MLFPVLGCIVAQLMLNLIPGLIKVVISNDCHLLAISDLDRGDSHFPDSVYFDGCCGYLGQFLLDDFPLVESGELLNFFPCTLHFNRVVPHMFDALELLEIIFTTLNLCNDLLGTALHR